MHYKTMEEVKALQLKFERRSLALEDWSHSARLTLCTWYLMRQPRQAARLLREGIRSMYRAGGVVSTPKSGYHETLTLFWIAKVRALLEVCEGDELLVINAIVSGLASEDLVLHHYSAERLMSAEARTRWREADLRPLPLASAVTWQGPQRGLEQGARQCA